MFSKILSIFTIFSLLSNVYATNLTVDSTNEEIISTVYDNIKNDMKRLGIDSNYLNREDFKRDILEKLEESTSTSTNSISDITANIILKLEELKAKANELKIDLIEEENRLKERGIEKASILARNIYLVGGITSTFITGISGMTLDILQAYKGSSYEKKSHPKQIRALKIIKLSGFISTLSFLIIGGATMFHLQEKVKISKEDLKNYIDQLEETESLIQSQIEQINRVSLMLQI